MVYHCPAQLYSCTGTGVRSVPVQCLFFCIPVLAKNGQICIFQRNFSDTLKLFETSLGFWTNSNILRKKQYDSKFVRALPQLQFVVKNDNFSFSTRGNRIISNYGYARNFWNQQSYLKKCAESESQKRFSWKSILVEIDFPYFASFFSVSEFRFFSVFLSVKKRGWNSIFSISIQKKRHWKVL